MKSVLKVEPVAAKLRELDGNFAAVARHFGVTRSAVQDYVRRHPTLLAAAVEARESMKDTGESSLYKAVKAGDAWAVCFFLKCQAKDRGYVERTETRALTDNDLDAAINAELAKLAGRGQTPNTGEASGGAGGPNASAP